MRDLPKITGANSRYAIQFDHDRQSQRCGCRRRRVAGGCGSVLSLGGSVLMKPESTDFSAPWETDIPCGSIHWRMGPGEDIMLAWGRSIKPLSLEERLAYLQRHPWPGEWNWWVDRMVARWRGDAQ
jgi:hypothetical protein